MNTANNANTATTTAALRPLADILEQYEVSVCKDTGEDSMMQATTLTCRFHVTTHGNGWAYTVTDQGTGESFFVQDDNADTLQKDSNDFEDEDVIAQYMEALGE